MAIVPVNKAQTGSATEEVLKIPAATAGNLLVMAMVVSGQTGDPKPKDTKDGETGWALHATHQNYNGTSNRLYVATKVATGGEEELNPARFNAGNSIQGIEYWELSGAEKVFDGTPVGSEAASAKTATSGAVTTEDAGSIILAICGMGGGASGTISAWTGTGPMTVTATTSCRCIGGYYIPAATVSAQTFTANWTTAHPAGMLVFAIKPTFAGVGTTAALKTAVRFAISSTAHPVELKTGVRFTVSAGQGQVKLKTGVRFTVSGEVAPSYIPLKTGLRFTIVSGIPPEEGEEPPEGIIAHEILVHTGVRFTVKSERTSAAVVALQTAARLVVTSDQLRRSSPTLRTGVRFTVSAKPQTAGIVALRTGIRITASGAPMAVGAYVALHAALRFAVNAIQPTPPVTNRRTAEPGHVAVGIGGRIDV